MSSLAMLVLLLALVGLDGFVVIPVPRTVGVRSELPIEISRLVEII